MTRLALALALMASTAHAGGLDDPHVEVDPCPPALVLGSAVTDEMLAGFRAIRAMSCGHEPRAFFDAKTGEQLTDDEILARVFDGSRIPMPIPLPASALLLLAGIGALTIIRRKS